MSRRTPWISILFLFEQQRFRRYEGEVPGLGFHVGIWWHEAHQLVTFLQSITEITERGHLIDSELSHDSVWDMARQELSYPSSAEYFTVPRGRILWDTVHQCGVVYHGNSTPATAVKQLARIYKLPRWQLRLDEHYLTGEALEDFYRIE